MKFTNKSFALLQGLAANNNSDWYREHKDEIAKYLLEPFAAVLEAATEEFKNRAIDLTGSADTMLRMLKDLRRNDPAEPFRTSVGGLMNPGGDKYEDAGNAYLQLAADGGWMGCGHWRASATRLEPVRRWIVDETDAYERYLAEIEEAGLEIAARDPLKTMPRGFADYEGHKYADHVRARTLIAKRPLTKACWLDGSVVGEFVDRIEIAAPLIFRSA